MSVVRRRAGGVERRHQRLAGGASGRPHHLLDHRDVQGSRTLAAYALCDGVGEPEQQRLEPAQVRGLTESEVCTAEASTTRPNRTATSGGTSASRLHRVRTASFSLAPGIPPQRLKEVVAKPGPLALVSTAAGDPVRTNSRTSADHCFDAGSSGRRAVSRAERHSRGTPSSPFPPNHLGIPVTPLFSARERACPTVIDGGVAWTGFGGRTQSGAVQTSGPGFDVVSAR